MKPESVKFPLGRDYSLIEMRPDNQGGGFYDGSVPYRLSDSLDIVVSLEDGHKIMDGGTDRLDAYVSRAGQTDRYEIPNGALYLGRVVGVVLEINPTKKDTSNIIGTLG